MNNKQEKIKEILERGVEDVVVKKDLEKLLNSDKKLKIYLGIDPTSTTIHLGNAVPLRKLRDFMNLGHEVIFLVGSFTALIGDTSDKDSMRPVLTIEEIKENFKTYKKQASKILDFKKAKVLYNGDWLSKLKFAEIVKLAQNFTVGQMIQRDMYQERLKKDKPIGLHEFLYPLMQGYDSVHMDVDLEIGGSDQLFNMLAGRTLQKIYNNREKHVLTTEILEGTDGRKMSKSYNNSINIMDSTGDMFGKAMSIKDELIIKYFVLCTDIAMDEITQMERELEKGKNPRELKAKLAKEIVSLYHSKKEANKAEIEFNNIFQKKETPNNLPEKKVKPKKIALTDLLVKINLAQSKTEAKRLTEQGGVKIDNQVITNWQQIITPTSGMIIKVGKRNFVKLAT